MQPVNEQLISAQHRIFFIAGVLDPRRTRENLIFLVAAMDLDGDVFVNAGDAGATSDAVLNRFKRQIFGDSFKLPAGAKSSSKESHAAKASSKESHAGSSARQVRKKEPDFQKKRGKATSEVSARPSKITEVSSGGKGLSKGLPSSKGAGKKGSSSRNRKQDAEEDDLLALYQAKDRKISERVAKEIPSSCADYSEECGFDVVPQEGENVGEARKRSLCSREEEPASAYDDIPREKRRKKSNSTIIPAKGGVKSSKGKNPASEEEEEEEEEKEVFPKKSSSGLEGVACAEAPASQRDAQKRGSNKKQPAQKEISKKKSPRPKEVSETQEQQEQLLEESRSPRVQQESKSQAFDKNFTDVQKIEEAASDFLSASTFEELAPKILDKELAKQLRFLKFETATPVQLEALLSSSSNQSSSTRDLLIRAPTGSGKTLAFLLPLITRVLSFKKRNPKLFESRSTAGVLGVVLSPTKELSNQSAAVCEDVVRMLPWLVVGSLSGGDNPKSEKARIRRGLHLVFATPGRLNYHLEQTASWKVFSSNFQGFVLDEADRLLDMGFEKQVKRIFTSVVGELRNNLRTAGGEHSKNSTINNFSSSSSVIVGTDSTSSNDTAAVVQTMLVSATLTPGVQKLAEFCLRKGADRALVGFAKESAQKITSKKQTAQKEIMSSDETDDALALIQSAVAHDSVTSWSIPSNLRQYALLAPTKARLTSLVSLLLERAGKVIVFFSSCAAVDFHHDLLSDVVWPEEQAAAQQNSSSNSGGSSSNSVRTRKFKGGFVGVLGEGDDEGEDENELLDEADGGNVDSDEDVDGALDWDRALEKRSAQKKLTPGTENPSHLPTTPSSTSTVVPKERIFSEISLFKLHGNLTADERNGHVRDFKRTEKAVLLASDVVARGFDVPRVDLIVQYDPPPQLEEYLHRVGRTARAGAAGESVLFLQPHEEAYLGMLRKKLEGEEAEAEVASGEGNEGGPKCSRPTIAPISAMKLKQLLRTKVARHSALLKVRDLSEFLQGSFTRFVSGGSDGVKNTGLLHLAQKAFLSWVKAYSTFPRSLKPIFNVKNLHQGHVAASFCLSEAPRRIAGDYRRYAVEEGGKKGKKGKGKKGGAGGSSSKSVVGVSKRQFGDTFKKRKYEAVFEMKKGGKQKSSSGGVACGEFDS